MRDFSRRNPRKRGQVLISGKPIPLYRIDLDKPPAERHREICRDFHAQIKEMLLVYDDILHFCGLGKVGERCVDLVARLLLRRVWNPEEMGEIRGIATETRLPVHFVIAFNTFLDLFSGCISGGVKEGSTGADSSVHGPGRMLHFRGLDWEMDPLREMIIQVEYVRKGEVVARAITYAGYVGTLTGVRKGLSISLNYRARIISSHSVFKHRWHQLALLLGFRPSITSQLRTLLLSPGPAPSLSSIQAAFNTAKSSPCYLTFCSPEEVLILENDLASAAVAERSASFGAVTNHDCVMETWKPDAWEEMLKAQGSGHLRGAKVLMVDSVGRKACVAKLWAGGGLRKTGRRDLGQGVTEEDVRLWLRLYPVRNECTHFSCIMDPSEEGGGIVWAETYDNQL